ncbi:transcriptional regulator [Actinophytocola sp.]|jgi:thiaminase|uniref:transcriptional regulator n=1 Tax=Actinophytocola sp. TaxID=1872138 RepID=UPI002EDB47DF
MNDDIAGLVARAQREIAKQATGNRFLDLLEAGAVPAERLGWLAGELYRLVGSDQRSQALLASRFPAPPAGELFLALAQGEAEALRLLLDFATAVGMGEAELEAYEPLPLAQAYPAYLTQVAVFGSSSSMALALLANVDESGGTYARVAAALRSRYGLTEEAVGHFLFFAETPPELLDHAAAVAAAGIAGGESPDEAVRTARIVSALETAFWDTLAEGLTSAG